MEQQNNKFDSGEENWKAGINQFSDMTDEERAQSLGKRPLRNNNQRIEEPRKNFLKEATVVKAAIFSLPYPNWTFRYGPIQDQGICGSCWAFTATGMLESYANELSGTSNLIERLSARNLVNCDSNNYGCDGGWVDDAFIYVRANGIATESEYPYYDGTPASGQKTDCAVTAPRLQAPINLTACNRITTGTAACSETDLIARIKIRPVGVYLFVNGAFQSYSTGIITLGCNVSNHAANLVGYGKSGTKEYWLVRNQWGTSWGEQGYARISRKSRCGGLPFDGFFQINSP